MQKEGNYLDNWYKKEDYWAIIIAMGIILVATVGFFAGYHKLLNILTVNIPTWSTSFEKLGFYFAEHGLNVGALFIFFALAFTGAGRFLGHYSKNYLASFSTLFILSIVVSILGSNKILKNWQLETPLLALIIGMLLSNTFKLPQWFYTGIRTEFYVKTGIVLMGATLPFTVIMQAGPMAILQASIVAITTFITIYLAATRLFNLDKRFGATLAAGGSICGVSAAIAIGGACQAKKEHVSVSISMVIVWAIAMIFALPLLAKLFGLEAGPAGAWIGTSEFADAAGFAAAEAIGDERAVKTFTLMKVVGRDMFVGVWALLVAFLSVTRWENKSIRESSKINFKEIWQRFPKFIIGFLVASLFVTIILSFTEVSLVKSFNKDVLGPIKGLRGWTFTWTFLCIGLTTRFKELTSFGWKPLAAFTIGVAINVPLGYILSNIVFVNYWLGIK